MAAPRSPGYYPAPDGRGEQWWNGVAWSEARRGAGSAIHSNITPSAGARRAAAPPYVGQNETGPYRAPVGPGVAPTSGALGTVALIFGAVSLFVNIVGPVAVIMGIVAVRRRQTPTLAVIGIVLGVIGCIIGLAQLGVLALAFTS